MMRPRTPNRAHPTPPGFTLVETLVVVLIIGILAALVVPRFTDAADQSRLGNTVTQLDTLRTALKRYRLDHLGDYPPADGLWNHLTAKTNRQGRITDQGSLGPYLTAIPVNVYTGSSALTPNMASYDATFGFSYDPADPKLIRAVGFDEQTQTFSTTPE